MVPLRQKLVYKPNIHIHWPVREISTIKPELIQPLKDEDLIIVIINSDY